MRRSISLSLAAAATAAVAAAASLTPAHAITGGQLDNDGHPMVGLMVAQDENGTPLGRCSGTLISETVFITAGHCTTDGDGGSVANVELWFGSGQYTSSQAFLDALEAGEGTPCLDDDVAVEGYPCSGEVSGTAYTHPNYTDAAFWRWDLGVVILDEAHPIEGDNYGELPKPGDYDDWRPNEKVTFTAVGFGLQKAHGPGAAWRDLDDVVRMRSNPRLILANKPYVGDYNMQVTNNARTGGTCSGDSGGPYFLQGTTTLVGVTSYGMSSWTCGGVGGLYRLDRHEDRGWLSCVIENQDHPELARECEV